MKASTTSTTAALRGFTLVEVMVALVIMAIMAVMAWQGIDGIIRARDASQARLDTTLRLNSVIAQWDQDLAAIWDTQVTPAAIRCDGTTVRLTRRTSGGIQLIVWALRPSQDGTATTWERWAGPSVTTRGELTESWLRSQQLQGGEAGSVKTIGGISDWKIYFYTRTSRAWGTCGSSLGGNSDQTSPGVPDGVRIVLTFAPDSGLSGDLTRDTVIKQ